MKGKDTVTMANGLKYIVIKENKAAAKAEVGNNVTLHYSGFSRTAKGFDSSVEARATIYSEKWAQDK